MSCYGVCDKFNDGVCFNLCIASKHEISSWVKEASLKAKAPAKEVLTMKPASLPDSVLTPTEPTDIRPVSAKLPNGEGLDIQFSI
jgi:predicted Fe-S protein YdhL (DUF1289 family)